MSSRQKVLAAIGLSLLALGNHAWATGPYDGAVRTLKSAVTPSRDGTDQAMLLALREMRDPTTRHLFQALLDDDRWQIQVHAVMGLAETSDQPGIEPALLEQVSAQAQEAVIAAAIDEDMLQADDIRALLEIPRLKSLARALLWAELQSRDEPIDLDAIRAMTVQDDDRVAGLAACLLAAAGDFSGLSAMRERLDATVGVERVGLTLWMIEVIRAYKISEALDWVRAALDDPEVPPEIVAAALVTVLELDPPTGLQLWQRQLGPDPSNTRRVQYGLLLLAADPRVPSSAYDSFETNQDLVRHMAAAGRALSDNAPAAQQLIELIDMGHNITAGWGIEAAASLEPSERDRVWTHVIDNIELDQPGQGDRAARAVRATALLYEVNPELVRQRLAAVEDDSITQQTILMALLEIPSLDVGDEVVSVRRIGAGFADSLVTLLIARRQIALSEADRTHLGLIASGGVPLPLGLQAQAAWLYLRHTASIERGLNDLLEQDSSGS
jgi:hypothetical protein